MDEKIIKVVNEARWTDGQNVRNRLDDITYNPMRSQEEFVSKEGIKMKRLYFVNGKTIIANSVMNMTEDEMKQTIIKQVEKSAPDQAQMIKDNIDQLMSTGMLKMDHKETATYELQDDGWVKSIVVDSTTETMGQTVVSKSIVTLK